MEHSLSGSIPRAARNGLQVCKGICYDAFGKEEQMELLVFLSVTGIIAAGIGVWGLIQLRNEDGCNAG